MQPPDRLISRGKVVAARAAVPADDRISTKGPGL